VFSAGNDDDAVAEICTSAGDDALADAPEAEVAEDSVETYDADADAGVEALRGQDGAIAPDDPELMAAIRDVAAGRTADTEREALDEDCGSVLAGEVGQELIGAADSDTISARSVLVVVGTDEDDVVEGWLLPSCESGPDESISTRARVTIDR
jgi:hypothetical protein